MDFCFKSVLLAAVWSTRYRGHGACEGPLQASCLKRWVWPWVAVMETMNGSEVGSGDLVGLDVVTCEGKGGGGVKNDS